MFEEISKELRYKTKHNITASNCENRWKHLERMYKKIIDNNKTTGRARKDFEYLNEMADILGKKRSINPIILLDSDRIDPMYETENIPKPLADDYEAGFKENNEIPNMENKKGTSETPSRMPTRNVKTPYKNKKLRVDILQDIRNDRREFYKKYLDIEEKKLQEKIKKNKILEEKNKLLKEHIQRQLILPLHEDIDSV